MPLHPIYEPGCTVCGKKERVIVSSNFALCEDHYWTQATLQGEEQATSANQRQIGGSHYKAPGKVEHWDIVAQHGLDYFQGQITKYVMRWKKKGGIQDLKKAQHFLEKYIEIEEKRPASINLVASALEREGKTVRPEAEKEQVEPTCMSADEYVKLAMRTKCDQNKAIERITGKQIIHDISLYLSNVQIIHAVTGINAEAGELGTALQSYFWYGKVFLPNFKEELGDLMWYIAEACDAMGFSLQDVMEANIRKLKVRYPDKFTEERAGNRDLEAEAYAISQSLLFPPVRGLAEKYENKTGLVNAETGEHLTLKKVAGDGMSWYGTKCEC